ncbi:type IV secretion system protein [Marinicella sp. W31]|uniref:type IV secretion system protein n=1 Tax=Marinicella sp. W31 TaxID=3023713 RepID=UPI003757A667
MAERNIVDQMYFDFYTLINNIIGIAFNFTSANWQNSFVVILTLAVVFVGYKIFYDENFKMPSIIKASMAILAVSFFLFNAQIIFLGLKFVFIDFFIDAGNLTINGILQASGLSSADGFSFEPNQTKSPFGALWDFCMVIVERLASEGGITDLKPYLAAAGVFILAVIVVVIQIILMVTGLLMGTVAILGFPVFSWMYLFKPLRPMFEKWVSFGLTGGMIIYFIIAIFGVIMIFLSNSMGGQLNYDVLNPNLDVVTNTDNSPSLQVTSALILFMGIAWKLIPKTENWASSIAAISAHGIAEGVTALSALTGKLIGGSTKSAGEGAVEIGKAAVNYGHEQIEKGAENYQEIRDQQLEKQLEREKGLDSNLIEHEHKSALTQNNQGQIDSDFLPTSSTHRSEVLVGSDDFGGGFSSDEKTAESITDNEPKDEKFINNNIHTNDDNSQKVDVSNQINEKVRSDDMDRAGVKEKVDQIAERQEAKTVEQDYSSNSENRVEQHKKDSPSSDFKSGQKDTELRDFERIDEIRQEIRTERDYLVNQRTEISSKEIEAKENALYQKEQYVDYLNAEYGESDRPESKEID